MITGQHRSLLDAGGPRFVFEVLLCLDQDLGHRLDDEYRIVTNGGLAGQHHGRGAVEHGVGDVGDLGAGRLRSGRHRLEHLRRGDDWLAGGNGRRNDLLLQRRKTGQRALEAEVATGNHDRVAVFEDRIEVVDCGLGFDLGDEHRTMWWLLAVQRTHVTAGLHKRDGDQIDISSDDGIEVLEVFRGRRRCRQAARWHVDTGATSLHAATFDRRGCVLRTDLGHDERCGAVAHVETVADFEALRNVIDIDVDLGRARLLLAGANLHSAVRHELDGRVTEGGADLGAGEVDEDADRIAVVLGDLTDRLDTLEHALDRVVRRTEAEHVHAGRDQAIEDLGRVRRRADRRNDLGATGHAPTLLTDASWMAATVSPRRASNAASSRSAVNPVIRTREKLAVIPTAWRKRRLLSSRS